MNKIENILAVSCLLVLYLREYFGGSGLYLAVDHARASLSTQKDKHSLFRSHNGCRAFYQPLSIIMFSTLLRPYRQ